MQHNIVNAIFCIVHELLASSLDLFYAVLCLMNRQKQPNGQKTKFDDIKPISNMSQQDKIIVRDVSFRYGANLVFDRIRLTVSRHSITAIMGPSGQGKSTLLGLFNRLWDDISGVSVTGEIEILLDNRWVSPLKKDIPLPLLRRKVGIVFQEPNPLPMSIRKNMAFPFKLAGLHDRTDIERRIQQALKQAFLWEEVKDRLDTSALDLSGGQKQRLCIARALVLEPEVLLCDEPTSSLDDHAAGVIEDLLVELKSQRTILVVSHNSGQVQKIADTSFLLQDGRLNPL